jgi:hypothetical protein
VSSVASAFAFCDDLLLVGLELGLEGLAERDRLREDDVHERPALRPGEERAVGLLEDLLVVGEDQPAPRAAQALVRRRRHDMAVGEGAGVLARRDEPRDVRDVRHQHRAALVGDGAELREVDHAAVRRVPAEQQLGLVLHAELLDRVVVDLLVPGVVLAVVQRVVDGVEILPREVELHPVREVPAVWSSRLAKVSPCSSSAMNTAMFACAPECGWTLAYAQLKSLRALAGERLDLVHVGAPAVVAAPGVPLGVLVGQAGPRGVHHRRARVVLARDQLDRVLLPRAFAVQDPRGLGVLRIMPVRARLARPGS